MAEFGKSRLNANEAKAFNLARQRVLDAAKVERDEELRKQELNGETPFEAARRRLREQREAAEAEAAPAQPAGDWFKDVILPDKVQRNERAIEAAFATIEEIHDKVVDGQEALREQIAQANRVAVGATGQSLIGSGLINVEGNQIGWRSDKESFGTFKLSGDKVWVYNGYINWNDTHYFVDSAALTLTDTAEYAYVRLNKTTGARSVEKASQRPEDTGDEFRWPIAKFVRKDPSGTGIYTWEPTKIFHNGDVQLQPFVPDHNSPYYCKNHSIEYRRSGDSHHWDAQIYEFDDPTVEQTGNTDCYGTDTGKWTLVARQQSDTLHAQVKYVDLTNFTADSAKYAGRADTVASSYFYHHDLEDHDDYTTGAPSPKNDGRIVTAIDANEWNWERASDAVLADTEGLRQLDSRWWPNTTYANPDDHDYYTSGFAQAGTNQGGKINDTNVGGRFYDGTRTAYLATGGSVYGDWAVYADGNQDIVNGQYHHEGVQGVTITDWIGGGIVTGSSVVEIDASDLRPTDKILVIR